MKLCSYTNFGALFSTVDVDFRFLAYIKIFEIAKFVYYNPNTFPIGRRGYHIWLFWLASDEKYSLCLASSGTVRKRTRG